MPLTLMYITNQEHIAKIAETSGVNWIFVDLEIHGKRERQGHLDTVISSHQIEDVKKIKRVLTKSELLVRINPIYEGSEDEINQVINNGADIVMLPFFKSKEEVEKFIGFVNGRAKTCLLWETPQAVEHIDSILLVEGIDSIHIGLNDLHLGYHMKFMFELLANGTVERLCNKFKMKSIPYGFGGIARLGRGILPSENIIADHYRLGSSMAILSRSFCNIDKVNDVHRIEEIFRTGVQEIRCYEEKIVNEDAAFFVDNHHAIIDKVMKISKGTKDRQ